MSELSELYQEVILDHNKRPRNYREIQDADRTAEGRNPMCGDQVKVFVKLEGDRIADLSFQGSGCAISKASASMMTDILKGKTVAEADVLFNEFHDMVTGEAGAEPDFDRLGKLAAFSGVCEYPTRIKCASLAWHATHAAIHQQADAVTTE